MNIKTYIRPIRQTGRPRTYTTVHKPPPSRTIVTRMNPVDIPYYVGKSIILFTMFYCGLNWDHFRNIRKMHEDDAEDPGKKK